jgi:putative membrane protein
MKRYFLAIGLLSFVGFTACDSDRRVADGEGYNDTTEVADNNGNMASNDLDDEAEEFMTKAALSGMTEVELSKLAQEKGTRAEVKEFGQMMVNDHSAANQKLKGIAQSLNYTLPAQLDEDHQEKINKLQELSGAEFDQEYVNMMVEAHNKDINLFEDMEDDIDNAQLKQFISTTLPTLRQHDQRINEIHDMMK